MNDRLFHEELLAVFIDEVRDHIAAIRKILTHDISHNPAWEESDKENVLDIFRRFHALKGAARAVGKTSIETIAHQQESALQVVRDQGVGLTDDQKVYILESLESIEVALTEPESDLSVREVEGKTTAGPVELRKNERNRTENTYIHLPFGRLQKLSVMITELLTGHERSELLGALLRTRLDNTLYASRLYEQGEQNAYENSVLLTSSLLQTVKELERWSFQIGRQLHTLRDEIEGLTFTPARNILDGLDGMVRGIARELYGINNIVVEMNGMDVYVDRTIVQKLRDPIIQLLRNAVDHGCRKIEDQEESMDMPSSFIPTILLSVQNSETDFVVSVSDNGQGPDLEKIAALGRQKGLLPEDITVSAENQVQILACVFEPGFSTRTSAGHISGRGIGLSVVKDVVQSLSGTVEFMPDTLGGSRVTLKVPFSQRRWNLLLVEQEQTLFALFGHEVEKVFRVRHSEIYEKGKQFFIKYAAFSPDTGKQSEKENTHRDIPLIPLSFMNAEKSAFSCLSKNSLNIVGVRVMGRVYGLLVEQVMEFRQLLVSYSYNVFALERNLIAGVTWPRGDRPVFVLNLEGIIQKWLRQPLSVKAHIVKVAASIQKKKKYTIMVIDDSPTTRMLEKNTLLHNGYLVETAENGRVGLEQLRTGRVKPHLILVDVEMPEMDGFAFIEALKNEKNIEKGLADIPVVFVSSRDGWAFRRKGLEKGARAFLLKQKFDQDILLELIESILG